MSAIVSLIATTTMIAFCKVVIKISLLKLKALLFSTERESWHRTCYPVRHADSVKMETNN